jgi:hypothetical protein
MAKPMYLEQKKTIQKIMDFKNSILILLIVLFVPSTLAWPFSGYSAADHDNKPPGCEDY